jgi:phosphosulfolactate phosphohydrolase-like enzyme
MTQEKRVKIDAFAEGIWRGRDCEAIVCVDVITAGTTLVTSLAQGRRTFALPRLEDTAAPRHSLRMTDVELGGTDAPLGPSDLDERTDLDRPLALRSALSDLLGAAPPAVPVFLACVRNLAATAAHLAGRYARVAVVAAGRGGEARFEDEMAAAWLAAGLGAHGHTPEDRTTVLGIERWSRGRIGLIGLGKSAESLRTRGLHRDLAFILSHVDDVPIPCRMSGREVVAAVAAPDRAREVVEAPRLRKPAAPPSSRVVHVSAV